MPAQGSKPAKGKNDAQAAIADSWDDDGLDSGSESLSAGERSGEATHLGLDGTADEPRTTQSASSTTRGNGSASATPHTLANDGSDFQYGPDGTPLSTSRRPVRSSQERPDKTAATASRLIAAGLGQRAPRRTEEQRKYDAAARDRLRKGKEEQKQREEEEKRAKASVWDD